MEVLVLVVWGVYRQQCPQGRYLLAGHGGGMILPFPTSRRGGRHQAPSSRLINEPQVQRWLISPGQTHEGYGGLGLGLVLGGCAGLSEPNNQTR